MKYKKSIYNIIIQKDDKSYIWNTLSGGMAVLDEIYLPYFLSENMESDQQIDLDMLSKNHFIVPEKFDEYHYVLERASGIMNEETPEDLFFVISPTLSCNYHCEYCFENARTSFSHMSNAVMDAVETFVRKKILSNTQLKTLHITWFGGEPLLRADEIGKMSGVFKQLCEDHGLSYRAAIITNGRYLNQKAIDILLKANITKLQISFDGNEEHFCMAKKATPEDYRITLSNVRAAAESGLPILIRINIRNNDFSPAYELSDLLLGEMNLAGKIKVYPAFTNEGAIDQRADAYKAFVESESKFYHYITNTYSEKSYFNKLAFSHGISCSLSCRHNCCIGPEGELYRCEHHFGQKQFVVGSIFEEDPKAFLSDYQHISVKAIRQEKCKTCPVFPICMGGCPNSFLLGEQNFDCESFVDHLIDRQLRRV